MDWKEFTASVIGDILSWPVIVLVIVFLVLTPLRKLIGRVKGAKGFGGEVEFGELLENAEENVDKARAEASENRDPGARTGAETEGRSSIAANNDVGSGGIGGSEETAWESGFKVDPGVNPSGAILESWEMLLGTISSLIRKKAGRGRPAQYPRAILSQLKKSELVSDSFTEAVDSLHKIRNQVAHGEADPTRGFATTYVDRARELDAIARSAITVEEMERPNKGT